MKSMHVHPLRFVTDVITLAGVFGMAGMNCTGNSDPGAPFAILQSLAVSPEGNSLLPLGETLQLTVTGMFTSGSTKDLTASSEGTTYQSSDESVVVVDMEGMVSAVGAGDATITVTNGELSDAISVTVFLLSPPPSLAPPPQLPDPPNPFITP